MQKSADDSLEKINKSRSQHNKFTEKEIGQYGKVTKSEDATSTQNTVMGEVNKSFR